MASSHSNKPTESSKSKSDTAIGHVQKESPIKNVPSDKEVMLEHGFYLGRKLGSGSYSKVRFAVTKDTFDKLAVKIIDRRRAPMDYQQCFLPRELSVVKFLKCTNIIRTYDWFEENQKIYQIMEFAENGDVLEYVRTVSKGAVEESLAQKWVLQTARAIAFMHTRAIAHRDVKCENLLLSTGYHIKLCDFGFARMTSYRELSQTFCGSAAYAAPEIIRSQPYCPFAGDVWALGVVAYILATGYMPFGDDVRNVAKILEAQQRGVHFPSSAPAISEDCKDLIRSMLNIDARTRIDIQMVLAHPWFRSDECLKRATTPRLRKIAIDDDEGISW
ncbi:testis-specific serine/threonine-protein kinase 3-like [Acanthaster planci]|uniref:Testis-specific serine/threonine-protein kinase 3-like n=1 Tax=Acanthaster planci TaxID=133434 RepID=A0A8B7Y957_ACAPL|nr:testis-specific serine/threonine-protein kinase 3-like [Acanthaster planci]